MKESKWLLSLKKKIMSCATSLHEAGMLAGADGNISAKISDHEILITGSGRSKARMGLNDFAIVDLDGKTKSGSPSSELLMHLEIYRKCPKAMAVIHAHPPVATAWTIAKPKLKELPCDSMSEVILAAGQIFIVPYARPGTEQMATRLKPYLPDSRLLLLARHGALSWGSSLEECLRGMERLEHSAKILSAAFALGGLTSLDKSEIKFLRNKRKLLGPTLL